MREYATEVLELQKEWTDKNSPQMQRRGRIIRKEIPDWLRLIAPELRAALGAMGADLTFEGSDGTGRKTETPWARFCSESRSPNPREGWYCVYLFHALGDGFYLSLIHGSTRYEGGEFRPRSTQELTELVTWARTALGPEALSDTRLVTRIDLGARKSNLGHAYADGTVAAIWYPRDAIPATEALTTDARIFARLLATLYQAQDLGRAPDSEPIDVAAAMTAIEGISRPLRRRTRFGQGYGLTQAERQAIERRAMDVAGRHLESLGFEVQDVSGNESFDLRARAQDEELIVEVKGTTGSCEAILLTASEVVLHRRQYPNNALILVYGIDLDRASSPPLASGGTLRLIRPWFVRPEGLEPTAFRYRVPRSDTAESSSEGS